MLFIGYSHVLKHGQHAGKLLLFVQIEVNREKILNNNRSCIMKTSLLLLLVPHKLIFKFSHKRDSKASNFWFQLPRKISFSFQSKVFFSLLINNFFFGGGGTFPLRLYILYSAWYNFLLLCFSNLERIQAWVFFSDTK